MNAGDDFERVVRYLRVLGWTWGLREGFRHPALCPAGTLNEAEALRIQARADRAEAVAARDRSIAIVSENAGSDWMTAAVEAIRHTATYRREFTTDHVLEDHPDLPEPHDPRAWGGATTKARDAGYIVSTGRMDPSSRRSSHARRKLAWRSLLIGHPAAIELTEVVGHG